MRTPKTERQKTLTAPLRLLRQPNLIPDLSPSPAPFPQHLDPRDPLRPQALRRRPERVAALAADHADGLQHRLPAVPAKHGRVVDPLEAGLELGVQRGHRGRVDAGGGRERAGGVGVRVRRRGRVAAVGLVRRKRQRGVERVGPLAGGAAAGAVGRRRRGGRGCGGGGGGGVRREGRQAALAEPLQDAARLGEEVVGALVLAAAHERQRAGEHVAGQQLHAALDDGGVGRDGRGERAAGGFGRADGGEHGYGEEGGAGQVCDCAVAEDVAVGEVGLDQRDFFDGEAALVFVVEGPAECFQAGDDGFPGVLGELLGGGAVGDYGELDEDVWM